MPASIVIYESPACPYCRAAKQLLNNKSADFQSIVVDSQTVYDEMIRRSGGSDSVPQIFIDERHIGGFDDMAELDSLGDLDPLLAG